MPEPRLIEVERSVYAFATAIEAEIAAGGRSICILPRDEFAAKIEAQIPDFAKARAEAADIVCLTHHDAASLDSASLDQIDRESGAVIVSRLPGRGLDQPLFLISIPKAGTHLLYRLAEAMGFKPSILCPELPPPGHWYCIEFTNSHTVPRDFFVDTVRRAPHGNRAHPFLSSAAFFIVRHPWDVLVSEARYYPQAGNTAFSDFYSGLDFTAVVERLLSDTHLLSTFRDRILAFEPWLSFRNVVPMCFEDLVGSPGGGTDEDQCRLIWSLQLKLGVPGRPSQIAERLFDRESPTFNEGQIGSHRHLLPSATLKRLDAQDADVLEAFGYATGARLSSRLAETWRRRALVRGPGQDATVPILIEADCLRHNIVRFAGAFYGVPMDAGPLDLANDTLRLATLPKSTSLQGVRVEILARTVAGQLMHGLAHSTSDGDDHDARLTTLEDGLRALTSRLLQLERDVKASSAPAQTRASESPESSIQNGSWFSTLTRRIGKD